MTIDRLSAQGRCSSPSQRGGEGAHKPSFRRRCGSNLKTWYAIAKAHPSVLILPALVLVVGITVGVVLVHQLAREQENRQRDAATEAAVQAASLLRLQLLGLVSPVASMTVFLMGGLARSYPLMKEVFPIVANGLLSRVDIPTPELQILLAPQAVVTDVFPNTNSSRKTLGLDFLGSPALRERFLPDINRTDLALGGPYPLGDSGPNSDGLAIISQQPIYFFAGSKFFNFSQPVPVSPFCPPTICWRQETLTKFWGVVFGVLPLKALLGDDGPIPHLMDKGYEYLLTQPADNLPATPGYGPNVVLAQSSNPVKDPVSVTIDVTARGVYRAHFPAWTLYVSPEEGYQATWEEPMYAVVVVVSVLLAVALLALMISRLQHRELLYRLVPEKMLQKLKASTLDFSSPPKPENVFAISTPAEVLLDLLAGCLNGVMPEAATCVQLRALIIQLHNIYTPSNLMEEFQAQGLDDDVQENLIKTLQGKNPRGMVGEWNTMRDDAAAAVRKAAGGGTGSSGLMATMTSDPSFTDLHASLTALMMGQDVCTFLGSPLDDHLARHTDCGAMGRSKGSFVLGHRPPSGHNSVTFADRPSSGGQLHFANSPCTDRLTSAGRVGTRASTCSGIERRPSGQSTTHGNLAQSVLDLNPQIDVFSEGSGLESTAIPVRRAATSALTMLASKLANAFSTISDSAEGPLVTTPSRFMPMMMSNTNQVTPSSSHHQRAALHLMPGFPTPQVTKPMYDELRTLLDSSYSSWTCNAFQLHSVSQGHSLSTLAFYLMHQTGLNQQLGLPPSKVARFFQALEALYCNNPYHNSTHAADVLQTMHVLLTHGGFMRSYVDPIRHLACILAAAAHDVDHVGLTNDYLIATDDTLALRYNDRSPMENHHLATLFNLLKQPQYNFISHLSKDVRELIRKVTIELVLGTDMKQHLTIMSQFKSVMNTIQQDNSSPIMRIGGASSAKFHRATSTLSVATSANNSLTKDLDGSTRPHHRQQQQDESNLPVFVDETERLLSLQMVLKVADLGSLAETTEVHIQWVDALETEFFNQGDKEREAGLPISPLFDRNKPGVTKCQIGFLNFVALPLFTSLAMAFPMVQPFVDHANKNLKYWNEAAASALPASPPPSAILPPEMEPPATPSATATPDLENGLENGVGASDHNDKEC